MNLLMTVISRLVFRGNKTYEDVTIKITEYEFPLFKDYLDVNETWRGTYIFIETETRNSSNPLRM